MYSSDLTDAQWKAIEPLFKDQCFRKHDARSVLNALFYINKGGCQWRLLPQGEAGFPPWQTVYYPTFRTSKLRHYSGFLL